MDLVDQAHQIFPGSSVVSCQTYEDWKGWLLGRLKALRQPQDLVTCIPCQGLGCRRCDNGKVRIGSAKEPPEEHCLEHGLRLACLARYSCPAHRLPWMDQVIEMIAARWTKVSAHNRPPF